MTGHDVDHEAGRASGADPSLPRTTGAVELGRDSVLGRLAADPRIAFTGFSAGVLQLMHPAVSAGVLDHSAFFSDPFDRIYRSIPRIVNSIVAPDSRERAVRVRDYHRTIKGTDAHGRRYHALDPDVYWWTHATFVWAFLSAADRFHPRPPKGQERERYYQESLEWWERYGLSMRPAQPDLASFEADFERTCRDELEWTRAARLSVRVRSIEVAGLPRRANQLLSVPGAPLVRLLITGGLPEVVRERFDVEWSAADRLAYDGIALAVRNVGRFVPDRVAVDHGLRLMAKLERTTQLRMEQG